MKKKDAGKTAQAYTYANHAINGLIGYVAYVLAFIIIVKLVQALVGAEEASEMMPLYVFFYIGGATLISTFFVMKKVKHDTGIAKQKTTLLMILAVLSFTVQFVVLNVLTRAGILNIEILIYFSVLVLLLHIVASYRFYDNLSSGRNAAKRRR
ncbi:hypothetical protein SAMN05660860_01591 [Geoalkalibacter ferrihydriticus]|uniref:Uncharacterized protein n=2 Tax=Geoalkalibacter ferrihydriticus TaxID=392333 RepID=A0A0C2DSP9_9BACT|nr:hypothetical protein [Geoalkalibacter ferrihydriticus]KIH76489.1 hypothetical protein GFER_09885 [Geoalkalibacter ferrihydriticus DSM 17813]SDL97928.1 hypothetical protein SAMN05660860_01591 [Geoalkalibacter ferrihydriticus]